jgi:hypothetical protein
MYATTIGAQDTRENEDKYGNGRSRILEILNFFHRKKCLSSNDDHYVQEAEDFHRY